jgi:hypothetical protein
MEYFTDDFGTQIHYDDPLKTFATFSHALE